MYMRKVQISKTVADAVEASGTACREAMPCYAVLCRAGLFRRIRRLLCGVALLSGPTYTLHTEKYFRNQPEIRLYLPFSDCFGTKRASVWLQINRHMVNTI